MTGEYAFGAYTLRVPTRELVCDGEAVAVEPRVFDLLTCLIEHRDRAVTKNELQDVVWPGVVVSETALTRAVMKARRAVDDHASHFVFCTRSPNTGPNS
ncbi:MAG: winged helix-turn-helix domain-containing protein, partial [Pseudomonadota bacterium]